MQITNTKIFSIVVVAKRAQREKGETLICQSLLSGSFPCQSCSCGILTTNGDTSLDVLVFVATTTRLDNSRYQGTNPHAFLCRLTFNKIF
jgi:hypothetical protein